jgi:hypothetical protein
LKNLPLIKLLDSQFKFKEKSEFAMIMKEVFEIEDKDIAIFNEI